MDRMFLYSCDPILPYLLFKQLEGISSRIRWQLIPMLAYIGLILQHILAPRHGDRAISVGQGVREGTGFFGALVKEVGYEKSAFGFAWS